MKKFLCALSAGTALLLSSPSGAYAQKAMPKTTAAKPFNVAILVYPGVEALDMSGSLDVFAKASEIAPRSYNVFTVAQNRAPFKTEKGILTLTPQYDLVTSPRPDIIVVPGASTEHVMQVGGDARVQKWLQRNASPGQTVMSVCSGAFILGRAGLLNGKNSTTHWILQSDLQRQFPKTKAYSGVRFVRDGNIISTAGVSSGIDGALQLVEDMQGKQTADMVARGIQYRRGTPSFPVQPHERVRLIKAPPAPKKGQKLALDYDPICHMKVTASSPNTFVYQGKLYAFCSPSCRDTFAAHPEQFIKTK